MRVEVVPGGSLSSDLKARWQELQSEDPALAGPYFCWEFTAAAAVRDNVFVAVLEDGSGVFGFFPYQVAGRGVGEPVGGLLSDYHGVIGGKHADFDARDLVRQCGLDIWDFDHLTPQTPFLAHATIHAESPVMDLREGFEAYLESRKQAGVKKLRKLQGLARKFEREVGPLRFETRCEDPAVFDGIIASKSRQCRRTGVVDFFGWGWTVELLRRVLETQTTDFQGLMSALYAGEQLVASHMGMCSRSVWHWWFPTYEEEFSRYSPGLILLLKAAEAAVSEGFVTIDLGKGDDAYKQSFMTGSLPLLEGNVIRPTWRGVLRRTKTATRRFLKTSPVAAPLRVPWRFLKKSLGRGAAHQE